MKAVEFCWFWFLAGDTVGLNQANRTFAFSCKQKITIIKLFIAIFSVLPSSTLLLPPAGEGPADLSPSYVQSDHRDRQRPWPGVTSRLQADVTHGGACHRVPDPAANAGCRPAAVQGGPQPGFRHQGRRRRAEVGVLQHVVSLRGWLLSSIGRSASGPCHRFLQEVCSGLFRTTDWSGSVPAQLAVCWPGLAR